MEGKFDEAEARLMEAYREASEGHDAETLGEHVLPMLVQLHCSSEPPNLTKAEAFSCEREQVDPRAYTKLQTAMMLYHVAGDSSRAVAKLQEAIGQGRDENDDGTVYSSLSLLGQALLRPGRKVDAVPVPQDSEQLVLGKKPVVVGDEALFLEGARAQGLEVPTVKRLASMLVF